MDTNEFFFFYLAENILNNMLNSEANSNLLISDPLL